jgi:hypothetical protein
MYLAVDPLPGQQRTGRQEKASLRKKFSLNGKKASCSFSNLQLSGNQQVLISPQASRTTLDQKRSKKNVILCGHVGYVSAKP